MQNKKIRKAALCFMVCALIVSGILLKNSEKAAARINTAAEMVQDIMGDTYGPIVSLQGDNIYNDMFEENLTALQDNNYIYLFNESGTNLKSIILSEMPELPLYDAITSIKEAEDTATAVFNKAYTDYFDYSYDIISRENGEGNDKKYTVEFWEKIEEGFYSGKKAAVILTKDGYLDSVVSRDGGEIKSTLENVNLIQEETAIDKAYASLKTVTADLENQENQKTAANVKDEDIPVVSDAYLSGKAEDAADAQNSADEPYQIQMDDKSSHTVEAYREINHGTVEWVINISNVSTNQIWGDMDFIVKINAITGETDFIDHTR